MNRPESRRAQVSVRGLSHARRLLLAILCLSVFSTLALAQGGATAPDPLPKMREPKIVQPSDAPKENLPAPLRQVGIDQRLNNQVPLDLVFTDESGQEVRLGQYFGKKPVVLSLVYYDCPMLCTQVLNGLTGSLKALKFDVGRDFEVVTVSFDPREKADLAKQKKDAYLARYGREGAGAGWHFLTGSESSIQALTDSVGFHFAWDEETKQFAHASGIMILTPEGKVSRYFYGIEYAPRDMQLGLVEASNNKIGSPVDQILLYCFHYDPQTGKYGFAIMNAIRILGFATFFGLALLIFVLKRREAGRQRALREA
ncbi:MAG TPA: SCO family protein [Pyrinomonadaceae bacterium]|nr:SCO family protein [Pyrinomonadaceae bacterium]